MLGFQPLSSTTADRRFDTTSARFDTVCPSPSAVGVAVGGAGAPSAAAGAAAGAPSGGAR